MLAIPMTDEGEIDRTSEEYAYYQQVGALMYKALIVKIICQNWSIQSLFFSTSKGQGIGKSSMGANLAPKEWEAFTDGLDLSETDKKKFFEGLQGSLVCEDQEAHNLTGRNMGGIKANISTLCATHRDAYGKLADKHYIPGVLLATGNDEGDGVIPLDPSGHRRFIPIEWFNTEELEFETEADKQNFIMSKQKKIETFLTENNKKLILAALVWFSNMTKIPLNKLRIKEHESLEEVKKEVFDKIDESELILTGKYENTRVAMINKNKYTGGIGEGVAELKNVIAKEVEEDSILDGENKIAVFRTMIRHYLHINKMTQEANRQLINAGFLKKKDNNGRPTSKEFKMAVSFMEDVPYIPYADSRQPGEQTEAVDNKKHWTRACKGDRIYYIPLSKLDINPVTESIKTNGADSSPSPDYEDELLDNPPF